MDRYSSQDAQKLQSYDTVGQLARKRKFYVTSGTAAEKNNDSLKSARLVAMTSEFSTDSAVFVVRDMSHDMLMTCLGFPSYSCIRQIVIWYFCAAL